ncbi:Molecular chaperone IbpA, HSP20 family [Lachnospiraceae bacterium]|nr:Molecular chaperone IbpA, HSP20 family [Lachnospiraceae bacterium]
MLVPSIFSNNFADEFFDDMFDFPASFRRMWRPEVSGMMQTDVKEVGNGYELSIELPGYKKEDLKAELKDGYLTINAERNSQNDEKDKDGKYVRRERYTGHCSRSFYVGEAVTEHDIHAKFEDGILTLQIPKKEEQKKVEDKKYIAIEG